jgi:alcohol dehydrogenase YqhD (iron-dependent ADH family)
LTSSLAAGGGSVIFDAAKFMALGSQAEGDPWDILSKGNVPRKSLPLGTILTLPAPESEMNDRASSPIRPFKKSAPSEPHLVYPRFSILDPRGHLFLAHQASSQRSCGRHVCSYHRTIPNLSGQRPGAGSFLPKASSRFWLTLENKR